jgi:Putative Flp pilus-assembly TadE/G-like
MKRLLKKFNLGNESGAALVMVAVAMVVLLGFTAITIDGGRLYIEKSKLQKALDAAVLAGAQQLTLDESQAILTATEISTANGYHLDPVVGEVVADADNSFISAKKTVEVPMTFAKALNFDSAPVTASAKAVIRPLITASDVVPIGIEKAEIIAAAEQINNEDYITDLLCAKENPNGNNNSGQHSPGNCGFLSFDKTGANDLREALLGEGTYSIESYVKTETGNINQAKSAIDKLISSDKEAGRTYCEKFSTANQSCRRVINVVVIDTWDNTNGRDEAKVVGFAAFWIQSFDDQGSDKHLKGKFMKAISKGEMEESNDSEGEKGNLLYGVKLSG